MNRDSNRPKVLKNFFIFCLLYSPLFLNMYRINLIFLQLANVDEFYASSRKNRKCRVREKEIHDTCTRIINSLLFDRGFNIGRDRNKSRGPSIRMTLDGSLQRRSVTCRYHSMPSPYAQYVWTLDTMRGERTTQTVLAPPPPRIAARFRTCSFLSVFLLLSPTFPPFLYSSSSFLLSRSGGEWFQSDEFRGRCASLRQNPKGDGGDSVRVCNALALCHFFIHPWFCGRLA